MRGADAENGGPPVPPSPSDRGSAAWLSQVAPFSALSADAVQDVLSAFEVVELPARARVLVRGQAPDSLVVLRDGALVEVEPAWPFWTGGAA